MRVVAVSAAIAVALAALVGLAHLIYFAIQYSDGFWPWEGGDDE